jgi:hypothetical protein
MNGAGQSQAVLNNVRPLGAYGFDVRSLNFSPAPANDE